MYLGNTLLEKFINGPIIKSDSELAELLTEWDRKEHLALYIPNFYEQTIEYLGEQAASIFGYPPHELIAGGLPGCLEKVFPEDMTKLNSRQVMYAQEACNTSFDINEAQIQEFRWRTMWPDGSQVAVVGIGVVLTFTENREFGIGVGFFAREDAFSASVQAACQNVLKEIKKRHSCIYQQQIKTNGLPTVKQFYDTTYLDVSPRELEILKFLASGLSTKKIAQNLGLSNHTVESHRRNLLTKFDARNSAELIKKATKIYWLE